MMLNFRRAEQATDQNRDPMTGQVIEPAPLTGPAMLLKSMLGIDPNMIMQAIGEITAGVKAMNEALARIEKNQRAMEVVVDSLARQISQDYIEPLQRDNSTRTLNGPGGDGAGDRSTGNEG